MRSGGQHQEWPLEGGRRAFRAATVPAIRSALVLGRFAPRSSACVPGGRHADRAMRSIADRVCEGTDDGRHPPTQRGRSRRPRVFTDTAGGCSLGGPSDRWRSGEGLPVLWPVPSSVRLLAERAIGPAGARARAARALAGCSPVGRSARWRSGDGLPVLWPVPSPVRLLAERTIDRREPCRQVLTGAWPTSSSPPPNSSSPPTLDAWRLVHGSTPSRAVSAIHRRSPRTRVPERGTSRSAVGDRVREPPTTTPSGGSDPPHRGTPGRPTGRPAHPSEAYRG